MLVFVRLTPEHGSWLNQIESSLGRMVKSLLRGIRVPSANELKARIDLYKEVNQVSVVYRSKSKPETLPVA